ncbi:MAG: transposase [Gammaproteobacteria bacterium]
MQIEEMSLEQLLDLNEIICRRIDELRAHQDFNVLRQLRIGQKVHFDSAEGKIFGTIIRINRKTVIVLGEDQRQWKISPGLLNIIEKVK